MGFVDREAERITAALRKEQSPERYAQLDSAQQALKWATEPQCFAAPLDMIERGDAMGVSYLPATGNGQVPSDRRLFGR